MDHYYYEKRRNASAYIDRKHARPAKPPPDANGYCSKVGHTTSQCYKKSRDQRERSQPRDPDPYPAPHQAARPPPPTSPSTSRNRGQCKECAYCRNLGHTIDECRKKRWQETRSGNEAPSPDTGAPSGIARARPVRAMRKEGTEDASTFSD